MADRFTYEWYIDLIGRLRSQGYAICGYEDWKSYDRCVILRHDVDYDLEKAVRLAEIEKENGVRSTYFILLTSDLYNALSINNTSKIRRIISLGHNIGLHFDEMRYPEVSDESSISDKITLEADILSKATERDIRVVAMHRPSQKTIESNYYIPNIINCYDRVFFKEFKYLSDSRMTWREPIEQIVTGGKYERLQILTHAFWYNDRPICIKEEVASFVNRANMDRYRTMSDNIRDLDSILLRNEVEYH